jgi:hypothetical protein
MNFHIYDKKGGDCIVKDASNEKTLYHIRSPNKRFSDPPTTVYRDTSESAPHIATIVKQGYWRTRYVVTLNDSSDAVVIAVPKFSPRSVFKFAGREFAWNSGKELTDLKSGEVAANFKSSRTVTGDKKGVLTVNSAELVNVDVIVVTVLLAQLGGKWGTALGESMLASWGSIV